MSEVEVIDASELAKRWQGSERFKKIERACGVVLNMTDFEHVVSVGREIQWLTANEAAAYLKVKTRTLLLWVRQGHVQAYALSGTKRRVWRFKIEDLNTALLSHPVLLSGSPTVLATERRQ